MAIASTGAAEASPGLQRTVGFWGLMFVSLGSIIGSGWLLSALSATQTAGPAAILSWPWSSQSWAGRTPSPVVRGGSRTTHTAGRGRHRCHRHHVRVRSNSLGGVLFFIGAAVKHTFTMGMLRHGYWITPWLVGMTIISHYGNYQIEGGNVLAVPLTS
ncbi:MAG: family permease [Mycobacterium sp.]|jgi:hypothetical protein|nr:family permease [Mycobacterium sp.]